MELTSGGDGLFGTSTKMTASSSSGGGVLGIDFGNVFPEVPIGRDEERNGHGYRKSMRKESCGSSTI